MHLEPYNFTIIHRAGRKHNNADSLSRMYEPEELSEEEQEVNMFDLPTEQEAFDTFLAERPITIPIDEDEEEVFYLGDIEELDEEEVYPTLEDFYLSNLWDDFESLPGAEEYPMTYALTYEEEELLWRYKVFESDVITFFNQQGNLNFNQIMKTLIADYTSEFEKYEEAKKWRLEYDQKKKQNGIEPEE